MRQSYGSISSPVIPFASIICHREPTLKAVVELHHRSGLEYEMEFGSAVELVWRGYLMWRGCLVAVRSLVQC
jgi:hypothetical protein